MGLHTTPYEFRRDRYRLVLEHLEKLSLDKGFYTQPGKVLYYLSVLAEYRFVIKMFGELQERIQQECVLDADIEVSYDEWCSKLRAFHFKIAKNGIMSRYMVQPREDPTEDFMLSVNEGGIEPLDRIVGKISAIIDIESEKPEDEATLREMLLIVTDELYRILNDIFNLLSKADYSKEQFAMLANNLYNEITISCKKRENPIHLFKQWCSRNNIDLNEQSVNIYICNKLTKLLASGFIVEDDSCIITLAERQHAQTIATELKALGCQALNETHLAILLRFVDYRNKRFYFKQKDKIGRYIYTHRKDIDEQQITLFIKFQWHCETIYEFLPSSETQLANGKDTIQKEVLTLVAPLKNFIINHHDHDSIWEQIMDVEEYREALCTPNPRTFHYNRILVCNTVAWLRDREVYEATNRELNNLLFPKNDYHKDFSNYLEKELDDILLDDLKRKLKKLLRVTY